MTASKKTVRKKTKKTLGAVANALLTGIEQDMKSPETRTAALCEVVRKLLHDNDYVYGVEARPKLRSITDHLPTRDAQQIPPLPNSG